MLLNDFAGKRITVEKIYESHHIGRRYIEKNYKDAIRRLEAKKKIVADVDPQNRKRYKGEVSVNNVKFTFPPKNSH
jgi:hypothetical protein